MLDKYLKLIINLDIIEILNDIILYFHLLLFVHLLFSQRIIIFAKDYYFRKGLLFSQRIIIFAKDYYFRKGLLFSQRIIIFVVVAAVVAARFTTCHHMQC